MLLRRIDVASFRGLRLAAVEFDPTTVLIGENSAGKSTLLDAIAICCSGRDDRIRLEVRDFHQGGDEPPSETLSIALSFAETDAEWTNPVWASFCPYIRVEPDGRRTIRLDVEGRRDPRTNAVDARWSFASHDDGAPQPAGLLAEWRRLSPILRLRANRYVEQDPRGEAGEPASADGAIGSVDDPVARQLERQIRLVYDRLTGASDIQDDELRRGLEAAGEYLAGHIPYRRTPPPLPPLMSELAETPIHRGRHDESLLSTIKQGTGARGVALVGLIGAVLEARQRHAFAAEAQPLLMLEDVEAHLHPTTMSAMWELVERLPAQKIVTTNSGELLAAVPLRAIRRLVTDARGTRAYRIDSARYSIDDLRHIAYHVRLNRAGALFARCWLFVEGETEAWLLPELAQLCGYDFPTEGIRCVEFAQSGLRSLLRVANDLGIEWHLLTDGDEAGRAYLASARAFLKGRSMEERTTMLEEADIEHCLYYNGYAALYQGLAGAGIAGPSGRRMREKATNIITRAIHARSKPGLALAVLEAANKPGSPGVPRQLRTVIERVAGLARAEEPDRQPGPSTRAFRALAQGTPSKVEG
jgi:putative ATP-dependent endonuclease of OLD family